MIDFKSEFPDFPADDMPAMPTIGNFVDTSWHNNACPSITSDKLEMHIWIDYADVSQRERQTGSRFIVESQKDGIETGHLILETDSWDDVQAAIVAASK